MMQPSLPFTGRMPVARACSLRAALEAELAEVERAAHGQRTQLARVLAFIRAQGPNGCTHWDILRAHPEIPRTSLCARMGTLLELKLIAETGEMREAGPYRKQCTVYVAVEYGKAGRA